MNQTGKGLFNFIRNFGNSKKNEESKAASPSEKNDIQKSEIQRRVHPRIEFLPLHKITFNRTNPEESSLIEVTNLSQGGIAFIRNSVPWPNEKSKISGILALGEKTINLTLEIAHLTDTFVGCKIESSRPPIAEIIHNYLRNELEGQKMIEVKPEFLQEVEEGTPHFFSGKNNCEFYYILKESQVTYFHLSFFGNYLEGGPNTPLKYGIIQETSPSGKASYQGSTLIKNAPSIDDETLSATLKFIKNIKKLDKNVRDQVSNILQNQKLSP